MRLEELMSGVDIVEVRPDNTIFPQIKISGISVNSDDVRRGDAFVCIKGTHTDGHLYAAAAAAKGAAVIVAQHPVDVDVPVLITRDTRVAEAYMWNNFYKAPAAGMTVIAVTGTNGKTSVSFMIREILRYCGITCGMIGTVRSMAGDEIISVGKGSEVSDAAAMTTPDPRYLYGILSEMRSRGVTHVVMEASSHGLSQHKLDPIAADIAVFTGLSPEHLDYHRTMEEYLSAKSVLFRRAKRGIINIDDPYGEKLCRLSPCEYKYAGVKTKDCDYSAERIMRHTGKVTYDLHVRGTYCGQVSCAMSGSFGVYNSLFAIGAAIELGVSQTDARRAMAGFKGVPGRMETFATLEGVRFIRDYAHTPDALEKVLNIMNEEKGCGRLVLLFGCGGDRDKTKRPEMGRIASENADFTIITSDNCRTESRASIIKDIMKGFDCSRPHAVIPDREAAIRYAVKNALKNDTVLLCGKGHEDYEITVEGMRPFDEVKIVLSEIKKRQNKLKG